LVKPLGLIGNPSHPLNIKVTKYLYCPWREPQRGWLTTIRTEYSLWTRHGAEDFLGYQKMPGTDKEKLMGVAI